MLHAVLCELEGVLIDTQASRDRALVRALAAEGVVIDAERRSAYETLPTRAAVAGALIAAGVPADDTAIEIATHRAEREFQRELVDGLVLVEGASELVNHLAGRARLAIVTRATRQEADTMLVAAGIDLAFELVVTADDAPSPKPSPAPYLHALDLMGRRRPLTAAGSIGLEDGWPGAAAARAAGIRCLAVGSRGGALIAHADGLLPTLRGQTLSTIEQAAIQPRQRTA